MWPQSNTCTEATGKMRCGIVTHHEHTGSSDHKRSGFLRTLSFQQHTQVMSQDPQLLSVDREREGKRERGGREREGGGEERGGAVCMCARACVHACVYSYMYFVHVHMWREMRDRQREGM